ncbi:MAG: hypothetical protein LUE92_17885, partial [Clostridiales bacterium]|nr:hypothetical protein [Clostridiales bacterium]
CRMETVPFVTLLGFVVAVAADSWMVYVFNQAWRREKVETELRLQKHLYEMERLRYERLEENRKETDRIRHDYQNYSLMLRELLEEKRADGA